MAVRIPEKVERKYRGLKIGLQIDNYGMHAYVEGIDGKGTVVTSTSWLFTDSTTTADRILDGINNGIARKCQKIIPRDEKIIELIDEMYKKIKTPLKG